MRNKYLIYAAGFIVIVLLLVFLFIPKGFRATKIIPADGSSAPIETNIILEFNEPIQEVGNIKIDPVFDFTYEIQDSNTLKIFPLGLFSIDQDYRVTVSNVISENGNQINEITTSFKAVYVEYADLPQDGSVNIQPSSSGENADPLFSHLPYENIRFSVNVIDFGGENEKPRLRVELFAVLNRPSQYDQFIKDLKSFKKEANEYIKKHGTELNDYAIEYYPDINDYQ